MRSKDSATHLSKHGDSGNSHVGSHCGPGFVVSTEGLPFPSYYRRTSLSVGDQLLQEHGATISFLLPLPTSTGREGTVVGVAKSSGSGVKFKTLFRHLLSSGF